MEKKVTTAKERASVYKEKGTTENSAIQMLQKFFFHFLLKDRKKPVIKCFFFISGILFATEGMKIYLFHLRLCMFRWMNVRMRVYNSNIYVTS